MKTLTLTTTDKATLTIYENSGYCLTGLDGKDYSPLELFDNVSQRIAVMIESNNLYKDYGITKYVCLYSKYNSLNFLVGDYQAHKQLFKAMEDLPEKVKGIYKVLGFQGGKMLLGGTNLCGGLQSNCLDYNTLNADPKFIEFKVI